MTECSQPMGNLEKFIPDKGKGQARLKHPFWVGCFFLFSQRQEKKSMAIGGGGGRKETDR